jgi:four helix bundle protein
MNSAEFRRRTQAYALGVIRLVRSLPREPVADVLGKQLLRCGTSVGANYRSACRAKSPADFIAKMSIVEEEADESLYWMDLLIDSGLVPASHLDELMSEGKEHLAMTVASIRTAKAGMRRTKDGDQIKEVQLPYEFQQDTEN